MLRVLILSLFLLSSSVQAQLFFDIGLKGGYGGNLALNSNVFDDADLTHKFSTAYTIGGKLGLNFTMESALTFELMYSGYSQDYNFKTIGDEGTNNSGLKNLDYNSMDILMLYRKTGMGQYVEIGGAYGIVNKGTYNESTANFSALDVLNQFDKNRLKAVVGFGSNITGGQMTLISLGLRVMYDVNDLYASETSADFINGKNYETYKKTNPLTALLILEINQGIGYFAQRSCPKRVKYFDYD